MDWDGIIRVLCENHPGTTPADYELLTFSQLALLATPAKDVVGSRVSYSTPGELASQGVIPPLMACGKSYLMRLREQKQADEQKRKRRERREKKARRLATQESMPEGGE